MESFWSLTSYWVSLVVVLIVSMGASAFIQKDGEEKQIKNKALIRDGIMGCIFTTIVWVMSPETMQGISESVEGMVGGAKEASATLGNVGGASASTYKMGEMDVQVGPARF